MVAMFFTVSVVNNYALNLNIAMPLHMIFRSVSTSASFSLCACMVASRHRVSQGRRTHMSSGGGELQIDRELCSNSMLCKGSSIINEERMAL